MLPKSKELLCIEHTSVAVLQYLEANLKEKYFMHETGLPCALKTFTDQLVNDTNQSCKESK